MEDWEFFELVERVAGQLESRVSEEDRGRLNPAEWGGEYDYMAEEMLHLVTKRGIPVSAEELDSMRVIAGELDDSVKFLTMLAQVKPQDAAP